MNILLAIIPPPDHIWNGDHKIAFNIGSIEIPWYGLFIFFAFATAIIFACIKLWKYYKLPVDPFYWFILIGVPTAIIGANFWSCLIGPPAGKPWSEFFTSFGQGLGIEGGVIFTIIAALIYFPLVLNKDKYRIRDLGSGQPQVRKISMFVYADAIVPAILIAQFIGRWGNYMNQEVYGGIVTDDGLAQFLHDFLPGMYIDGAYREPLFLWEGIANASAFLVLFFACEFIPRKKAGDLACGYVIWYGTLRLCLEPLRDSTYSSSTTMVTSGLFVAVGIIAIILNHTITNKTRTWNIWTIIRYSTIYFSNVCLYSFKNIWNNLYLKTTKKNKYSKKIETNNNNKKVKLNTYNENKLKFIRTDSEKLYYFNR